MLQKHDRLVGSRAGLAAVRDALGLENVPIFRSDVVLFNGIASVGNNFSLDP